MESRYDSPNRTYIPMSSIPSLGDIVQLTTFFEQEPIAPKDWPTLVRPWLESMGDLTQDIRKQYEEVSSTSCSTSEPSFVCR